jgi:hypothetical protein
MLGRNPLDTPILPRRDRIAGPLVALQRRSDGSPEGCLDQPRVRQDAVDISANRAAAHR